MHDETDDVLECNLQNALQIYTQCLKKATPLSENSKKTNSLTSLVSLCLIVLLKKR